MKGIFASALLCAIGIAAASDLPNPSMTPGAIDPDVTQANIQQTVCVRGYTKTIRPPAYFTNRLKKQQIRQYGYDSDLHLGWVGVLVGNEYRVLSGFSFLSKH